MATSKFGYRGYNLWIDDDGKWRWSRAFNNTTGLCPEGVNTLKDAWSWVDLQVEEWLATQGKETPNADD